MADIPPPPEAPPAGIPAPPPSKSGLSPGLRTTIVVVVVAVLVIIGTIGYAIAGFAYASTRISGADRALNAVVSHQNSLTATFKEIDTRFSGMGGANFSPQQARTLADQFVSSSQAAETTVEQDDASLVAASKTLNEQEWLTVIARGNLDKEAQRIGHARKALAAAKTLTTDYVLDGQFLQSFLDSAADLDALGKASSSGDVTGAKTTLTAMKAHVDKALQLSTSPGLPTELHSLMVDFQKLVTDFGQFLDAAQANDATTLATYEKAVEDDATKIGGYNFDKMSSDIDAFYQQLVDRFNSEMAAATATSG